MKLKLFKRHSRMNNANFASRGFTMIELLISIAIFTLLSAVTLAKYNTFNNNAEFTNATESIVLALRQAQVYGVAAKSTLDGGGAAILCPPVTGSAFDCVYGVHLDAFSGDIISPPRNDKIVIFVDENRNYIYDSGETIADTISWKSPIIISGLVCGESVCSGSKMDITFRRPNPDGFIAQQSPCTFTVEPCTWYNNGPVLVDQSRSLEVGLISLTNGERSSTITTSSTGQISLK